MPVTAIFCLPEGQRLTHGEDGRCTSADLVHDWGAVLGDKAHHKPGSYKMAADPLEN
jgi:hypothetical protein